ncbi:MAG: sugar ABC transporter permease [Anaerolineae bacterium]|nr:sugar ABC transporter permease [Anaerolineae bacterium]
MEASGLETKSATKKKGKLSPLAAREERAAYLFLLPWILGVIFFLLGPILASFALSFTKWNLFSPPEWVGLANYQKMFHDRDFYNSMGVTLKYMLLSIPLFSAAALGLSVLLNQKLRGMYVLRTVMFMPSVLAGTAVAVMFSMLLQPDAGIVNQFLRGIGIANPPRWLMSEQWAVPAIVLMGLWGIGGGTIIYLAGLQNIPPTLYEAADIDGASAWQKFTRITLPLLTPTIFFQLITSLAAAFQIFDIAFVLSGRGARRGALMFYLLNIYNESFRESRFGYASALAWVLVLISAITILVINSTSNRWVYYEVDTKGES